MIRTDSLIHKDSLLNAYIYALRYAYRQNDSQMLMIIIMSCLMNKTILYSGHKLLYMQTKLEFTNVH